MLKKEKNMKKTLNLKKINKIDIFLGFIFLFSIIFLYFFFKREEMDVIVRVRVTDQEVLYAKSNPDLWYANQFRVGEVERDSIGKVIAEIIAVESIKVNPKESIVYLDLRLKATHNKRTETFIARGKKLAYGAPMRFNFDNITFDGHIVQYPNYENDNQVIIKKVKVAAIGRHVEPSLAQAINIDDVILDSKGNELVRIVKKEVLPAEIVTTNNQGDPLLRYSPVYKDLFLTLVISAKEVNNTLFIFDKEPLTIGTSLPLNFKKVSVFPMVTDFELN